MSQPQDPQAASMADIWRLFRPHRGIFVRLGLLQLGIAGAQLLILAALPGLIEGVSSGSIKSLLGRFDPAGLLFIGATASLFLRYRLPRREADAELSFLVPLQERLLEGLWRRPPSFWARQSLGELSLRLTEDLSRVLALGRSLAQSSWVVPLQTLGYAALLYWMAPQLLLPALVTLPLFALISLAIGKRLFAAAELGRNTRSEYMGDLSRLLVGAELLQASESRREMILRLGQLLRQSTYDGARLSRLSNLGWQTGELLRAGGVLLVLAWGQDAVQRGSLSLPTLLGAAPVLFLLFGCALGLIRLAGDSAKGVASARRILPFLQEEVPVPPGPAPQFRDAISLQNMSFSYETGRPVLRGLSLDLRRKEKIAISGPSGSGKTTLLRILLGVERPASGRILLDGRDVTGSAASSILPQCALVTQLPIFPARTVRANLLLANPHATEEELWRVLEAACLAERIRSTSQGLNCDIGETGNAFSGGERERLAIARALLSPAPILLLDEPSAFLDAQNRERIFSYFEKEGADRTLVIVTHQEDLLRRMGKRYSLENGILTPVS